jgi:UDP-N-acetylmuramoyl-tripeptide--D-alanyl-D-alanine ligase
VPEQAGIFPPFPALRAGKWVGGDGENVIPLVLSEVIAAIGARMRERPPGVSVRGISTDSRTTQAGDLFFALSGPSFDGHDFVWQAIQRGAVGAVIAADRSERVSRSVPLQGQAASSGPIPAVLIEVESPLAALGRLAAFHRSQSAAEVIAVVGSNGKTTTKAMIDHVLAGRRKGRSSPRSFNNSVGVPLTLLSAEVGDEYLVVEIGTNAPGEIGALAKIAEPDIAVVTSIGEEHLEGLGDLQGVAREELSALEFVREGGFAAVNIDSPHVREYPARPKLTRVKFGMAEDAELRITAVEAAADGLQFTLNGRFGYRLPLVGVHNAWNATAAVAVARRLGMEHEEIAARLATFAPQPMRGEVLRLAGVTIINDAYNANPASAAAAIQTLEAMPARGRRLLVLGEMRELGGHSEAMHRRLAESVRRARIDGVLLVGRAAALMSGALANGSNTGRLVEMCDGVGDAAARLTEIVRDGDVVLLKASRAVGLERVVEPLRRHLNPAELV